MYALSTASFQLRDQLIGLVGSVSQRLGAILGRTHSLADAERVRINRIASEIASLQSSILDAINSSTITSPRALTELYDLELGAIRTIEQIEVYLATVGSHHQAYSSRQTPAAGTWHQPQPAQPYAYGQPQRADPAAYSQYPPHAPSYAPAPPRHHDTFIDVEAVPVSGYGHDEAAPAQLRPAYGAPPMSVGEAVRSAVADLNGYAPPPGAGFQNHPPGRDARALVVVKPAPLPQAANASLEDEDEPRARAIAALLDRLFAALAHARRSPWALGGAVASLLFMSFGWTFLSGHAPATGAKPKVSVIAVQSQTRQNAAAPDDRDQRLPARPAIAPTASTLYVPVIATVASRSEIEERLSELSRSYPDILSSPDHARIEPVLGSDGRQWYRAYLLPGRARADIQRLCQTLRDGGHVQCWPKRLKAL